MLIVLAEKQATLNNQINNKTLPDGTIGDGDAEKIDQSKITTWIHEIFQVSFVNEIIKIVNWYVQGTLTNETRCLNCESERTKDEDFLDLSVDVEQNTSISHCLQCFSNTETMQFDNKYYCEVCCCKQEAQKRLFLKSREF